MKTAIELLRDYIEKTSVSYMDTPIEEIFYRVMFVNETDKVKEDAVSTLNGIGEYIFNRTDLYLYKKLRLTAPAIDRKLIINRLTTLVDLSKSITPLLKYDDLITEVIDSSHYDWRLMVLDGVDYTNPYGEDLELLYPCRSKGLLRNRKFYRDALLHAQKAKATYSNPEDSCKVILTFIYWIRKLACKSNELYGCTLNFTDILMWGYLNEMYNSAVAKEMCRTYCLCEGVSKNYENIE